MIYELRDKVNNVIMLVESDCNDATKIETILGTYDGEKQEEDILEYLYKWFPVYKFERIFVNLVNMKI